MSTWRDNLREAKGAIHETMGVSAVYLTALAAAPVRVTVRVNVQIGPADFGDQVPTFYDTTPRVVFDQEEVTSPLSRAYLVIGPEEMYRLGPTRPPRSGYVAAEVTPLSAAEMTALLAAVAPLWPDVTGLDDAWEGII